MKVSWYMYEVMWLGGFNYKYLNIFVMSFSNWIECLEIYKGINKDNV